MSNEQKNTDLPIPEIYKILNDRNIPAKTIKLYKKTDRFTEYLANGKYILRISESELPEQKKHYRVNTVAFVPKIHSSGSFNILNQKYYYLIVYYAQGSDLWSAAQNLTHDEQANIGKEIAQFLDELHLIGDKYYDIGHYIPTITKWEKTWEEGHLEYAAILYNGLNNNNPEPASQKIISKAFDYIYDNIKSLKYQQGAKLLHNDFHPKNIIVHEGRLSGVTDWECSQFGEADFELSRLFDWCVYPDNYLEQKNNIKPLLKSIIKNMQTISSIPQIEKRMTVYQLEHELNQLIWNGKKQEEERICRITGWLNGKINSFLPI